jgi:FtsP/CotA-like multicopper oxidase with cupredoxin domain
MVLANDYVPVEPYTTNVVTLGVGQRTDVLVNATGKPGDTYWLRTRIPPLCSLTLQPFALTAIYYEGADTTERPKSLPQADWLTPVLLNCANVSPRP